LIAGDAPELSHENYWRELGDYFTKLDAFSKRHWKETLDNALGINTDAALVEDEQGDISLCRVNMFIPESPIKE